MKEEIRNQLDLMNPEERKDIIIWALTLNRKAYDHHKCDCETLTYICPSHGTIMGSNKQLVETSDKNVYYDEDE